MSLTTKYHPATNGQTDKGGHANTFDKALSVKPSERDRSRLKGLLNWSCMTQPTRFLSFKGFEFAVCFFNFTYSSTKLPCNYTEQL